MTNLDIFIYLSCYLYDTYFQYTFSFQYIAIHFIQLVN